MPYPGTIKINVQGAFIVDEELAPPSLAEDETRTTNGEGQDSFAYKHDIQDIRLPNHTAVVSHVAVDVRSLFLAVYILSIYPA